MHDLENPERGMSVHFMNVEINVNPALPNAYKFRKYDKRRALPFKYTQYIKYKSNRSVKQAYNIAISQLVPILYIPNRDEDAIAKISLLIATMMENGFNKTRLINSISRFLIYESFPGIKLNTARIFDAIKRSNIQTHTSKGKVCIIVFPGT